MDIGADDRRFERHRFEQDPGKRFLETGADKQVGQTKEIIDVACFVDDFEIGEFEGANVGFEQIEVDAGPAADQDVAILPAVVQQGLQPRLRPHADKSVLALAFANRADVGDDDLVVAIASHLRRRVGARVALL